MEMETENQKNMEQLASPFKILSIPSSPQPLQPISSERQNQQRIPQSPSLPSNLDGSDSPRRTPQHRSSDAADVKARIAYLNAIAQTGSPSRSASPTKSHTLIQSHAAMQRAMLGREEAEGALAATASQIESYKAREKFANDRIDQLQNQIGDARNRQKHERTVYEKEIKLSKKAEFKAEMAVIKLQEDLREVRTELEGYKGRSEHERAEKEKARQEAFERAYAIAGMTEELQDIKQRLEIAVQERDTAVAMAASNLSTQQETAMQTEMKLNQGVVETKMEPVSTIKVEYFDELDLEASDCPLELKYAALQSENDFLRSKVQQAQEAIHFAQMECQFKACACRRAERQGLRFVHDHEADAKMRARIAKKRKAEGLEPEEELPVQRFKSWAEERAEAKGKQPIRLKGEAHHQPQKEAHQDKAVAEHRSNEMESVKQDLVFKGPEAPLPPATMELPIIHDDPQSLNLTEAAHIPLPSMKASELDNSDDTAEPTAQLEDLTQVIVEQGDSAQNFHFSMSTTSNKAVTESAPTIKQPQNIRVSDDLFDISPPKQQMPPRPSTAMGLLTIESPIRLVPHSPQVFEPRSTTPGPGTARPQTTRVALNDTSPVRQARQHRQQPRPNVVERTRGRSPGPVRPVDLIQLSPAQNTLFPITPVIKQERSHRHHATLQPRPQTAQDHYPSTRKETSTTTTVPLRGNIDPATEIKPDRSSASGTPFSVPGTPNMTREQALAQIRARRDRARSVNMRRSAEESSKTPGSAARRGVNLKDRLGVTDDKGRDFSQASAPGRI